MLYIEVKTFMSHDKKLDSFKVWLNFYEEPHHRKKCEFATRILKRKQEASTKDKPYGINPRNKTHKVYIKTNKFHNLSANHKICANKIKHLLRWWKIVTRVYVASDVSVFTSEYWNCTYFCYHNTLNVRWLDEESKVISSNWNSASQKYTRMHKMNEWKTAVCCTVNTRISHSINKIGILNE